MLKQLKRYMTKSQKIKKKKHFLKYTTLTIFFSVVLIILIILFKEVTSIPTILKTKFPELKKENISVLDHYYANLIKSRYLNNDYQSDKNDIPIYYNNGKHYYHPIVISYLALGAYEYYLNTNDIDARNIFLKCADWLKDNLKEHGGFYYWEYTFEIDYPGGVLGVPWFSAMSQGEGAIALLRAFSETKDDIYLQAAKNALRTIFYDISKGGVSVVKDNYILPQEYPTNPPSDILNGAISAYFGVYEYYRVTGDQTFKKYSEIIIKTFLEVLEQYDTSYWSLYSRWPPNSFATPHYNSVHIAQLRYLYLITGNEKFNEYSQKFENYQNSWINRTKYVLNNHFKQLKEFSVNDIKKVPIFLRKIFDN